MAPIVHGFDWPDRFVIGTVGRPGERTFYLQARTGDDVMSVALEKQQSAILAERVEQVLDELMEQDGNPFSVPAVTPPELVDDDPLDQPVEEQFRTGVLSLGWDPTTAQVVIEAYPFLELEDDSPEAIEAAEEQAPEVFVVRIPVGAARAFALRTRLVVGAGRPLCPTCGEPMDPDGHVCIVPDGLA